MGALRLSYFDPYRRKWLDLIHFNPYVGQSYPLE